MTEEPAPAGAIIPVTDASYRQLVAGSEQPVLLAFVRDGDSTCRALYPVLADLARDRTGRLGVATVDVDANPVTIGAWGVTSVPVMLLLHRGVLQRVLRGVRPYIRLSQEIDEMAIPDSPPSAPPPPPDDGSTRQLPELPL